MIGQTIESRPRLPLGAIFWLMAALLMDVLAVLQANVHIAVGSLFPWFLAILFWRMRERSFTVRFTETGLEVQEPALEVRYAELQGLLAPRRPANPFKAGPRSYLIHIFHLGGVVRIPARLNLPSDEVFSFLYGRFPPSGSREMPSKLVDFLRQRERRFGPEQVWTYRSRVHIGRGNRHPRWRAFFLALTLAAAAWLAWGIVQKAEGWIIGGSVGLFLGGWFLLLLWLDGRRNISGIRRWQQCGLVVAPDGLALLQGDLVGELRWDEVRDVKIGQSPAAFQFTISRPPSGIVLKVEGAIIVIADVYDRPLALIHQNIRHYWQGQRREDDWDRDALPSRSSKGIRPME